MSEITYMTGAELASAITSTSQAVSGMTIAEAATALGGKSYETNGLTEILTFPINESKGGTPLTVEAQYAADLWNYWKTTAAAAGVTTLGAAAASAKTWASGVLFGDTATAGTLAGTGGLLTMSLPAVAAAVAPILGVSLGATLYQSNPGLWTKISQALLPWAYKDTQTMAAVVDSNGQVYIPKEAVLAIKQLFEDEGIGGDYTATSSEYPGKVVTMGKSMSVYFYGAVNPYSWLANFENLSGLTDFYIIVRDGLTPLIVSRTPGTATYKEKTITAPNPSEIGHITTQNFSIANTVTIDNVVYYYGNPSYAAHQIVESSPSPSSVVLEREIIDIIYNGTVHQGGYPEGTSEWTGDNVDIDLTPTKSVVTSAEGYTKPYFPITLPIGDPIISPDPAIQPDPTAPVEFPQIDPYVAPEPAPEMWPEYPEEIPTPNPDEKVAPTVENDPVYIPNPNLNPNIDPSAEPDPDLDPAQEPARPIDPPQPSGVTPGIVWPPANFPTIVPTTGSGLVHVYNPSSAEFISFGNWLWVTYADPSIDKLWNNPFDGIIGAHELYATPSKDGTDTIKSGFLDSGINSTIVQNRYVSINCGSMVIPEYYGNYLDYSPYSKAFIYLPFIGIVEVDVDDIVGHSVNILYHVDSYNGSCIAQVTVAKDNYVNTIYQFSGNCAVDIPLAGGSQAAIRAGMISAAAYGIGSTVNGVINGAALGAIGGLAGAAIGGITGAIGSAGAGIANVVSQKSTVQHSGSFGASYGAMGIKKPYIIIRRPVQKFVNGYQRDYGYPAYIRVTIGSCTGYLRVREVNVQSTLATDDEKVMIENLLKSGVYID